MRVLDVELLFDFLFLLNLNFGARLVAQTPELLLESLFLQHLFRELFLKLRGTLNADVDA